MTTFSMPCAAASDFNAEAKSKKVLILPAMAKAINTPLYIAKAAAMPRIIGLNLISTSKKLLKLATIAGISMPRTNSVRLLIAGPIWFLNVSKNWNPSSISAEFSPLSWLPIELRMTSAIVLDAPAEFSNSPRYLRSPSVPSCNSRLMPVTARAPNTVDNACVRCAVPIPSRPFSKSPRMSITSRKLPA